MKRKLRTFDVSEHNIGAKDKPKPALGADLIIPVLAAGFTIYFLVTTSDVVWEARANGTVIGLTLLTLIAIQVVRIIALWREGAGTMSFGEFGRMTAGHQKRLTVLLILVVFVATIPWLGTTLGLLFSMFALMWVLGVRDIKTLVGVSFVTAAAVYLLFIAFLKTQLPAGPIEHLLQPLFG
ncbi:MAG: hypothetical protein GEU95_00695 [Rhizobiales bacterium]|nr:hypothetical protein [Hyphomicrobiales bacterium]